MPEREESPHRRLHRIAEELALVQKQLRQLLARMPPVSGAAEETDLPDDPQPRDRLRSTLECVLADRLDPALNDLLAAASLEEEEGVDETRGL